MAARDQARHHAPIHGSWPLTGREREFATVTAAMASDTHRGIVICGPAGGGKSRLASESLAHARDAGHRTAHATASRATAQVPLGAIAQLLPPGVSLRDPVAGFREVARHLASDRRTRLVLHLDDGHFLDATSAVLLRQLMDADAIFLVLTRRTGEPVSEAVTALETGDVVARIDLPLLTRPQTEELLTRVLGRAVGHRTVYSLFTSSGGNVLYLRELVLGALAAARLTTDGEVWELTDTAVAGTERLRELIGNRLRAADRAGREVLEMLAVCGPICLDDVAGATDQSTLLSLEAAGLVVVSTSGDRLEITLAHPLYGEVLHDQLSQARRRQLFLAQAQRVEQRPDRTRQDILDIASWRLAATGTADPDLLIEAAVLARYAHDHRQSTTLLRAVPEKHQTTATRLLLGEALYEVGEPDAADAALADAASRAVTEPERLAVTFARATNAFWGAADSARAFALVERARPAVSTSSGSAALQRLEGSFRVASGDLRTGLALLDDAGPETEDAPYLDYWLHGQLVRAIGLVLVGRPREAGGIVAHSHAVQQRVVETTLAPHPAVHVANQVLALAEAGDIGAARRVAEEVLPELAATRERVARTWIAFELGRAEALAGHVASSRRWYAESRTPHLRTNLRLALSGLAEAAALLGDIGAARAALRQMREHPEAGFFTGEDLLGPAWTEVAAGRLAPARALLARGAQLARRAGNDASEARLLTDVARLGGAGEVVDRLSELAGRNDGTLTAARARLTGGLASGDARQLNAAGDALGAVGADLLAAEAYAGAAGAWRAAGQARQATAAMHRALALARRCEGARTPLLAQVEPGVAPLTRREREIADLAARGMLSREIAQQLHLSVRTVDNHLHRVYAKLGVSTRRELADALAPSGQPT